MRVFITGATGFIGQALATRLLREGHTLTAWVRSPARARARLAAEVQLADAGAGAPALAAAIENADAIINLAGEPIAGGRWTEPRRRRITESRIDLTNQLVDAVQAATKPPAVLVSASGVHYYGDRGDELLDESSAPGQGFLAEVCLAWERAALRAEALGVRVMCTRQGVVMGTGGGFLRQLLPIVRTGLGASLGNGRQFLPWIHLEDLLDVFSQALTDPRYRGPVNLVAPQAVRTAELMDALGRAVGRKVRLGVPGPLLRLALGQAADLVLQSQRLDPARLRQWGHSAKFPEIDAAFAQLVGRSRGGPEQLAHGSV